MTSYSISQHRCARCYDSKKTLPKKPRDWNICDRVSVVFIIASHKKIMWLLVNSRKKAICNLWPYINWLFRDRAVRFALPGIIGNFFKHSQIFCQWWLSVLYILETLRSVPVRFRKKNKMLEWFSHRMSVDIWQCLQISKLSLSVFGKALGAIRLLRNTSDDDQQLSSFFVLPSETFP